MNNHGYAAYREAQADQLDQAKLVLMMFAGSINFLNKAVECAVTDPEEMARQVTKAKNVILELMSSLNMEEGGDMGEVLLRTYRGLFIKLNVAYIEHNVDKMIEVRDSLIELEETWRKVFQSPEYKDFKRDRERFARKHRAVGI